MKKLKPNQIYYCPENDEIYLFYGGNPSVIDNGITLGIVDINTVDWSKLFLIGEL